MILEEMFNGRFYPCETVVADSLRFKQATKASVFSAMKSAAILPNVVVESYCRELKKLYSHSFASF